MKEIILTERRLAVIEEKLEENQREHSEIKSGISEVKKTVDAICKEVVDLRTNHIVFKTKVIIYWGVGVAVLSSVMQLLINYIGRHL